MNHIGGVHSATDGAGYRRSWAQVAEATAREAIEALALVEEPIRKRFCARSSTTNAQFCGLRQFRVGQTIRRCDRRGRRFHVVKTV